MAKFITQLRHGTTADWEQSKVIPAKNELIVEYKPDGTRRFKLGDGTRVFTALDYVDGDLERLVKSVDQRVSSLILPAPGAISSDQEVADIRNSFDGETVYERAGDAVRAIGEETYNLKRSLQQFIHADAVDGLLYENNQLYLTADGQIVSDPVEITGGGGGGGEYGYSVRIKNHMMSTSFTAATSAKTLLTASFEEYYGPEQTDASGTLEVLYKMDDESNDAYKTFTKMIVPQSTPFNVDVTDILVLNRTVNIKFVIEGGGSGSTKSLTYSVGLVEAKISAVNYNPASVYSGNVTFQYKCIGRELSKTVHFVIDGVDRTTDIGTSHNKTETYVIETVGKLSYGAHDLRVYFTTPEGAKSNELRYTLLYNNGTSRNPMIGVISSADKLTYGDTLTLDYVVFTPNQETTDELIVTVYSEDALGNKIVHSTSTLSDIENNVLKTWQGSNYPSSGSVYIEFKSGTTVKTVTLTIEEVESDYDLTPVTANLVYEYSAAGRSNNDSGKDHYTCEYTTADNVTTTIHATFEDFNWVSNGYVDGEALTISGDAIHTIKLPMFATSYMDDENQLIKLDTAEGATVTTNGRTFEIEFSVNNVTDINAKIIKCMSANNAGFVVTPQNCYLLSSNGDNVQLDATGFIQNEESIPAAYIKDEQRIRLDFVIEPRGTVHYMPDPSTEITGQCVNIYINGEFANSFPYPDNARFAQTEFITIGHNSCITNVYDIKIYNRGLTPAEILQNYKTSPLSAQAKISRFLDNDVLTEDGDVDYYKAIKKYPCLLVTGPLSPYKGANGVKTEGKVECGLTLTKPDGSGSYTVEVECLDKDPDGVWVGQNNVQGTSSVKFPVKNYKVYFGKNGTNDDGSYKRSKVKYSLKGKDPVTGADLSIPESTLCWKGDYMSSDHANTFNANLADGLFNDVLASQDPAQGGDARVQNTVYGFRCLLFRRDDIDAPIEFAGDGALNNDKGNTATFGLEHDDDDGNDTLRQKWEFKNNTEALCSFRSDKFFEIVDGKKRVLAGLESTYPDQGDLEEEGLEPKYDQLQVLYTWVVQRANFWDASTDTLEVPLVYKGQSYTTERDYRKAIFLAEFDKHFNRNHALVYYLFCEFVALCDNRAKNLFLRCEDVRCEQLLSVDGNPMSIYDAIDMSNGEVNADMIDWENSTFAIWITDLYDLDSCFGVENSGYLQIPYYAEWDYKLKDTQKFNGYDSRLWLMFEEAMASDIENKAKELTNRSGQSGLNYESLYTWHIQDNALLVCPAVVNRDMEHKYSDPWTEGFTDYSQDGHPFRHISDYKYLQRGSRTQQKDAFINRRCNMLYSKYNCDKFLNNNINFRAGVDVLVPDSDITITASQAIYPAVKFGDGDAAVVRGSKVPAGQSTTIRKAGNAEDKVGFSDTIYIAGGTLLTDIGDISKFYPYELQLQNATGLKVLTIGSTAEGYNNPALKKIDTTGSKILEELNIAGCSGLTGTLDLSKNGLLRKVITTNSGLSSVLLPDGGVLEELYLGKVQDIEILNQTNLSKFSCSGYDNLSTLRVENTPSIKTLEILATTCSQLAGIRLVGINETATNDVLELLVSEAIQGKYIDNKGTVYEGGEYSTMYPHITGTIRCGEITPELFNSLKTIYPELTIVYSKMETTLTFMDRDGTVIGEPQKITSLNGIGGNGYCPVKAGEVTHVPTLTPENLFDFVQYNYTWQQDWTTEFDDPRSIDPDALKNVTENRIVYPAFRTVVRSYDVNFWNDNVLLGTVSTKYNTTAVYGDANNDGRIDDDKIPVKNSSTPEIYQFTGWHPQPVNVDRNMNCYAQYYVAENDYDTVANNDIDYRLDGNKIIILDYIANDTVISIPETFTIEGSKYTTTEIGGFDGHDIELLLLPDFVETFRAQAFNNCTKLTSITVGEQVKSINDLSFANCTGLKEINYNATNATVTRNTITSSPFENSISTEGAVLKIGSNVQVIPNYLFYQYSSHSTRRLASSVIWDKSSACKEIGKGAFYKANLAAIELPDAIETIGAQAFSNNSNLEEIRLPAKLKSLGENSFEVCSSLKKVWIPKTVTAIGKEAFANTSALQEIQIEDGNEYFTVMNGCLIRLNDKCLLRGTNNASIPDGFVSSLDTHTFSGLSDIQTIVIPDAVDTIPAYFAINCKKLDNIRFPANLRSIGSQAFFHCESLCASNNGVLELPEGLTEMLSYCFSDCSSIEEVRLPKSLATVSSGSTFENCKNLKRVYFKNANVKYTGTRPDVFKGCSALTDIYWPGAPGTFDAASFGVASITNLTVHYNYEVE